MEDTLNVLNAVARLYESIVNGLQNALWHVDAVLTTALHQVIPTIPDSDRVARLLLDGEYAVIGTFILVAGILALRHL